MQLPNNQAEAKAVCKASLSLKEFVLLFVTILFTFLIIVILVAGDSHSNASVVIFHCIASIILILLASFPVFKWLTFKAVLYEDVLEVGWVLARKRIMLADIEGRRAILAKTSREITLFVPEDSDQTVLRLRASIYKRNPVFASWVSSLPDLDARDLKASRAALMEDVAFGETQEQRAQALSRHKNIANTITFSVILISLVEAFDNRFDVLVPVLCGVALLAIVLRITFPHAYRLISTKNSAYPAIGATIFFPGFAFVWRAYKDVQVPAFPLVGLLALFIAGAMLCIASGMRMRELQTGWGFKFYSWLTIALTLTCYGFIVQTNMYFDHVPSQQYVTRVLKQAIESNVKTGDEYYVYLAPWAYNRNIKKVAVSYQVYNAVSAGGTVCANWHKGAYGIAWYKFDICH